MNKIWTKEKIIEELNSVIDCLGYFPSTAYLRNHNKSLYYAICNGRYSGKINDFRVLLGYKTHHLQKYWTEDKCIKEIKKIIYIVNNFPTLNEIKNYYGNDLVNYIRFNGGIYYFQEKLGYECTIKKKNYWTDETIISELKKIYLKIGEFPSNQYFKDNDLNLSNIISKNGGINKFRKIFNIGYVFGAWNYWNNEVILDKLRELIATINKIPTEQEVQRLNGALAGQILQHGGFNKFYLQLGYELQEKQKLASYITNRGKKTEKLVIDILKTYCLDKGISFPLENVKLCKGNIIEFVCNTDKKIGIDVTNTNTVDTITRKWLKKDYHKQLDELWIVVVSDSFGESYYELWNKESPDNVYIYSIEDFCKELDYDIEESLKNKIEKYKVCTFHTRNNLKQQSLNTSKIV